MDPYNQHNDPNRESYPPQNTYQQAQIYYPDVQNPYPQQTYPNVQNTSYPSYNANTSNTIQYIPYAQQPPVYLPSDNLNALDQGWFQCYKVLLYIYLVLLGLGTIGLIQTYSRGSYGNYLFLFIFDLAFVILRLVLVIFQIQAIQGRDLKKAKTALTGFLIYLVLAPIYIFGVYFWIYGYLPSELVIQNAMGFGFFVILVLIGSIQVYQFLKRNKPTDNYQAANNNA